MVQSTTSKQRSAGSWSVAPVKFVARLKNKVNQKYIKYFVNHFYPEADSAHGQASPPPPPPTPSGVTPQYTQTTFEFSQIDPRFGFHFGQSSSQRPDDIMVRIPTNEDLHSDQYWPEFTDNTGPLLDQYQGDESTMLMIDHHHLASSTAHDHRGFLQDFDHQHEQMPISGSGYEYYEMTEKMYGATSTWQGHRNYSQECGTPSMSMEMSGDTLETVDSQYTMDSTGDSNFTYILPPEPVNQRQAAFMKKSRFLTVGDLKRFLLGEEAGRRFRVVASIVYAYRRLRGLVRRKRNMQRSSTTNCPALSGEGSVVLLRRPCKLSKRIRSLHRSKVYLGIKQRSNGKWVAEIRVSQTTDKVWLGSFQSEKQAALAYDAGIHHCCAKRVKNFNFHDSPQKLGPSQHSTLIKLSKEDRKARVQKLAYDYAMTADGE